MADRAATSGRRGERGLVAVECSVRVTLTQTTGKGAWVSPFTRPHVAGGAATGKHCGERGLAAVECSVTEAQTRTTGKRAWVSPFTRLHVAGGATTSGRGLVAAWVTRLVCVMEAATWRNSSGRRTAPSPGCT